MLRENKKIGFEISELMIFFYIELTFSIHCDINLSDLIENWSIVKMRLRYRLDY